MANKTTNKRNLSDSEYLDFLADSEKILGSSIDYDTTLKSVAKLAVPTIADWFSVDVFGDGEIEQIAVAHKDPAKVRQAKRLRKKFPPQKHDNSLINQIIKTQKTQFVPHVTDELLKQNIKDNAHKKLLKSLGITSVVAIPLKVQGDIFGAITFVMAKSQRRYTKQDVNILEYFTDRAAQAIEHAKLYQDSLHKQEKLDRVLSQVPGIVWESVGRPGSNKERVFFVSSYLTELLGYSVEAWKMDPKLWLKTIHPEDTQKVLGKMQEVYDNQQEGILQYRVSSRRGGYVWVENRVGPVVKKQKVTGLRGVAMDVSERVEWEERRQEFINMVSHELRTPITSLNIYSTLLERRFSQNGQLEHISSIYKMRSQVDRLSELVQDLLDMNSLELGKLSYTFSEYDLYKSVKKVIKKMHAKHPDYKISLQGKVSGHLKGDKLRMEQAIENMIDNAIKYSPDIKKVEVILKKQKGRFSIIVKDYGVGLSQESKSKIFNKFYRGETSARKTYPGLGVGLFFTSQIAKQHGGVIAIDESSGKGTSFRLEIPQNEETYSSS